MRNYHCLSPLDGRYAHALTSLRPLVSEAGLMQARIQTEVAWLLFLSQHLPECPTCTPAQIHRLETWAANVTPHLETLYVCEQETRHDVKAVEYLIKGYCESQADLRPLVEWIHFGCTSEDINNVAYALMLKRSLQDVQIPTLRTIYQHLYQAAEAWKTVPMLCRTHGQPASPSTLGKEVAHFAYRLHQQLQTLETLPFSAKWNGAVGNFNAHHIAYPEVPWITWSQQFITGLGLDWHPLTTQIEPHDSLAAHFHALIRIHTILLDACRDFWGYISRDYFRLRTRPGEIGSSTMPHKVNPIDFENAEGNLGLANAWLGHCAEKLPISRGQRDLSDSTVLRNLGVILGHGQLAYHSFLRGLELLSPNTEILNADLAAHPEVLAEAIQTVMRRYGIAEPYEKLKALTRGKPVTHAMLSTFIQTLPLPEAVQRRLQALQPSEYVGLATALVAQLPPIVPG